MQNLLLFSFSALTSLLQSVTVSCTKEKQQHAFKNKYSKLQCNHLKKFGDYCGVHSKCKNITRIDHLINNSTLTENSENNKFNLILIIHLVEFFVVLELLYFEQKE